MGEKIMWISVKDRLPSELEGRKGILIGRDNGVVCTICGYYVDDEFFSFSLWMDDSPVRRTFVEPTHWMPLPTPPINDTSKEGEC